jgi:hypothetical protein
MESVPGDALIVPSEPGGENGKRGCLPSPPVLFTLIDATSNAGCANSPLANTNEVAAIALIL